MAGEEIKWQWQPKTVCASRLGSIWQRLGEESLNSNLCRPKFQKMHGLLSIISVDVALPNEENDRGVDEILNSVLPNALTLQT